MITDGATVVNQETPYTVLVPFRAGKPRWVFWHSPCTASSAMRNFQGRMLQRAAEICGGYSVLCAKLGVSAFKLRAWIEGNSELPDNVFLIAADIVLEDDIARAA